MLSRPKRAGALLGWSVGLAVLIGCGPTEPLSPLELSGRVTVAADDDAQSAPVANATVEFTSDTRISRTTTTDGSGRYRLELMSDHSFGQVRATADGFFPSEQTVYFDSPARRIDLAMRRR